MVGRAYLGKELLHHLGAVVDSKHDVGNTSGDECLDLVHNHGLVAEFNEGLGQRQGLFAGAALSIPKRFISA